MAIIDTTAIRQEDLWPALVELGGQEVLDDYILKIALTGALKNQGLQVLPIDIQAEDELLATLTPHLNEDAFDTMLRKKGYGNFRKAQLLWRNAALRKLIQNQVDITAQAVQRMFSIVHGPAFPTRLIVVSTLEEANEAKSRLNRGVPFSDVAIEVSIDSSASSGGRVNPISTADPAWPSPIREALSTLEVNAISNPIFIGDRWVVLEVTNEPTTSTVTFEDVESEMRRLATFAQERFLMENLATTLVQNSSVDIIDIDLKQSGPNSNPAK